MVRTNQGGSMINFLVIGGAMALLLIGGAYVVRRNFAPAERSPQVAVSDNEDTSPQGDPQSSQDPADAQKDKNEEPKPDDTQPDTAQSGAGSGDDDSTSQTPVIPEPAPASENLPSSDLPETGPSNLFIAGTMQSSLVGLATAYVQSRRLGDTL